MISAVCGLVLVLLLFVWFALAVPVAQASNNTQVIVALKHSEDVVSLATKYKVKTYKPLKLKGLYLMELPDEAAMSKVLTQLMLDGRVRYAEPNYLVQFHENANYFGFDGKGLNFDPESITGSGLNSSSKAKSNASNQWAWEQTGLTKAQKVSQGKGVTVAILDSGVNYNHPDFNGTVQSGWSAIDGRDGMDNSGHGTYVAGIIHQIAPEASILPVRVLDDSGVGTISNVVEGTYWAYENGATIINFSFSSTLYSQTLKEVVTDLAAKNVLMIASAGNNNSAAPTYPAALSPVIAVSATDQQDNKALFSNYGIYVDVSAPGVGIYSFYWKGGYAWADGTSFAAPMLAGAAALYRAKYSYQDSTQAKSGIVKAVNTFPVSCKVLNLSCFGQIGKGRLDFARLL
jgi:thermitase